MRYIYAALLLHECGKEINEENMRKVLEGVTEIDEARLKVVVESLKDVNIEEAIAKKQEVVEEKKEEVKKEEKKEEKKEMAAEGLAALFG